jgi:hypothetical protein
MRRNDGPRGGRTRATRLLLAALATTAGCEAAPTPDIGVREQVAREGDAVALTLMQTLSGQLTEAIRTGGPEHAIDFCAGRAQELTAGTVAGLGPGWEVKRTTVRPRNPANEADALELEALEYFHAAEAAGQALPEFYVQPTATGDYRYYRPLVVGALCVECHGPRTDLDPAMLRVLDERYPGDQATGYQVGDLRGVIRVTVPGAALARDG